MNTKGILNLTILAGFILFFLLIVFFVVFVGRDKPYVTSQVVTLDDTAIQPRTYSSEKISRDTSYRLIETQKSYNTTDRTICELAVQVLSMDGTPLEIEGFSEQTIKGLSCANGDYPSGYETPYEVRVSNWSSITNSFIINFGMKEDDTLELGLYEIKGNKVLLVNKINIPGEIVVYSPSLKYILTSDFKVFNNKGDLVTDFAKEETPGVKSNTFLVKDTETFLITTMVDNEQKNGTYTLYFYLLNPDAETFYLAGFKTFESRGLGCEKNYIEIDIQNGILSNLECSSEKAEINTDPLKF